MPFVDRRDAGRRLAERVRKFRGQDVVVLGLPRGGVPIAAEVARALGAPLDVVLVRKLGVPFQPELAFGAIGEGGTRVINSDVVAAARLNAAEMAEVEQRERSVLEARLRDYRAVRPIEALDGRTAIVVDDGVATGGTARAACRIARARGAARVVLAVPVGAPETLRLLREEVNDLVALETPERFHAVGMWYRDFGQTTDAEVVALLRDFGRPVEADPPIRDDEVHVVAGAVELTGLLTIPEKCAGMVIFAHGSGSSRHSPRNRFVAHMLNRAGLATLLLDLLPVAEEADRARVFDIDLLAARLVAATRWTTGLPAAAMLPVGYFGASTGAAAALVAATAADVRIDAVVCRGGRPDLAGDRLSRVRAATLLIVGGRDHVVLDLNRGALAAMVCESDLVVVPGATHLFSEPGALEQAAQLAREWFTDHLVSAKTKSSRG
jgi:putative phosphoribosyl transferase